MSLGMAVGLNPGHTVLDGYPAPPKRGTAAPPLPPIFSPCLLWPNGGWLKMPLDMEVGLSPGHIVLDGDPAPSLQRGTDPQFSAHVFCG